MANTNFDKYLEEKIKSKPALKQELQKVDCAVEVAYQIHTLRKKKRLTQSQLAKLIGVSQSNVARIENADYNHYTMKTLDKVENFRRFRSRMKISGLPITTSAARRKPLNFS